MYFCLHRFFWATRFLILIFSLFFVSGPRARLSWPSRQLLSARKSTVSYRIVSYRTRGRCANPNRIPEFSHLSFGPWSTSFPNFMKIHPYLFELSFQQRNKNTNKQTTGGQNSTPPRTAEIENEISKSIYLPFGAIMSNVSTARTRSPLKWRFFLWPLLQVSGAAA